MIFRNGRENLGRKSLKSISSPKMPTFLSMQVEENENVFSVAKLAEERLKDARWKRAMSAVCAKSDFAERGATMSSTNMLSDSFFWLIFAINLVSIDCIVFCYLTSSEKQLPENSFVTI